MPAPEGHSPLPRRRRLRTSLRAPMVFVLAIAAGLGWRVNRAHTQARAVARIRQAGGQVRYDFQFDGTYPYKDLPAPPAPAWLRRPLGDEYFQEVTHVSLFSAGRTAGLTDADLGAVEDLGRLLSLHLYDADITDAGLAHLAGLRGLRELLLMDLPRITDAGLAHLAGMTGLRKLILDLDGITDVGLTPLSRLTGLRELTLSGDRLTGAGLSCLEGLKDLRTLRICGMRGHRLGDDDLAHLAGLAELRELDLLWQTRITDAGLRHLRGLHQLRALCLENTSVGAEGIADLKAAIPGLAISR